MGNQWHFDADTYLAMVRSEIPSYDDLQERLADATAGIEARSILDLGSGTGVTASRVQARHPLATLVGIDMSADMLAHARTTVPSATFLVQALEDPLPAGPFDLAVSAFAVHHLDGQAKADLFGRVAGALRPGGRFVLCDVVVPRSAVRSPIPLDDGIDLPDTAKDQLSWLEDAGFAARVTFEQDDLAIFVADHP